MARSLTSSVRDQLSRTQAEPCLLLDLEFDGKAGGVKVWNGVGDLTFDGDTYAGVGNLGTVSSYTETSELRAEGMSFTLSGIPASQISLALSEEFQQRRATLWLGFFDDSISPGLLNTPMVIFRGRMDTMDITRGVDKESSFAYATVTVNAESIFMALERAPMRRYLAEDHNVDGLAPSSLTGFTVYDKGFDQVPSLQNKQIYFGGPGPSAP